MNTQMNVYDILNLDVWGNEDDGWSVNAAYYTGRSVELSENEINNNQSIINKLIAAEMLIDTATTKDIEIEGDETMLYLNNATTGCPIFHLQPMIK